MKGLSPEDISFDLLLLFSVAGEFPFLLLEVFALLNQSHYYLDCLQEALVPGSWFVSCWQTSFISLVSVTSDLFSFSSMTFQRSM